MKAKTIGILAGAFLILVISLVVIFNCVDHNDVGNATVVQFPNGKLEVITDPGIFFQGFGKLTVYITSNNTLAFSKHDKEGDPGDTSIPVRFRDGGEAKVTMDVTFMLPGDKDSLRKIHTDWQHLRAVGTRPDKAAGQQVTV